MLRYLKWSVVYAFLNVFSHLLLEDCVLWIYFPLQFIIHSLFQIRTNTVHSFLVWPPVELNKDSLCSIQLTNKTVDHVAFKVWVTNFPLSFFHFFSLVLLKNKNQTDLIYDSLCWDSMFCCMQGNGQRFFFQVKITSPKKYFVRPKVGIIEPNSTRGFTGIYFWLVKALYFLSCLFHEGKRGCMGDIFISRCW